MSKYRQRDQGELSTRRIDSLPEGLTERKPDAKSNNHIVGHSETGHHHVVDAGAAKFYDSNNPLVSYLEVFKPTQLVHQRSYDTHAPLVFDPGVYEIRHQRESAPEGFQRVLD